MNQGPAKRLLSAIHARVVFQSRVSRLAEIAASFIPIGAKVLDLGCGDGSISKLIMASRPDLDIEGVDVLERPDSKIPMRVYDGMTLPFPDGAFAFVLIVDVLHHTTDPSSILAEAVRVASEGIVVKDHLADGLLARPTLRFMDWVGNWGHGVGLPYNYLNLNEWKMIHRANALKVAKRQTKLGLYPWPASLLFDRKLHFVELLRESSG